MSRDLILVRDAELHAYIKESENDLVLEISSPDFMDGVEEAGEFHMRIFFDYYNETFLEDLVRKMLGKRLAVEVHLED